MMDAKPPTPRSQPPQGPAAPDDLTNYQSGGMFGRMVNLLKNGWPHNIHLSTSLRVGSGSTAGAALDGGDGRVIADGALAIFIARDRADNTKFLSLRKDTTVRVNTTEGGDIQIIDPTTGIFTLAAATVVSAFTNSWADAGAGLGVSTVRYRKDLFGNVQLIGVVKSGTIGLAAFALPLGFRPFTTLFLDGMDVGTRTGVSIDVQAGGSVIPQTGTNTTGIAFNLIFPTVF